MFLLDAKNPLKHVQRALIAISRNNQIQKMFVYLFTNLTHLLPLNFTDPGLNLKIKSDK